MRFLTELIEEVVGSHLGLITYFIMIKLPAVVFLWWVNMIEYFGDFWHTVVRAAWRINGMCSTCQPNLVQVCELRPYHFFKE